MRPPNFVLLSEIFEELENIVEATDIDEVADQVIEANVSEISNLMADERLLTHRLLQEYSNFIKRKNLDRYNPTHHHEVLDDAQLSSLIKLQKRISNLLRYRLFLLHLIFLMLHHTGRDALVLGTQKDDRLFKAFLDEITDLFDLVTDDHTVILFKKIDREALRIYFKIAVGSLEQMSTNREISRENTDIERVRFLQIIVRDYFSKQSNTFVFINFYISRVFDIAVKVLENVIKSERLTEIEKMHTEEILIVQYKIISRYYSALFYSSKLNHLMNEGKHRLASKCTTVLQEILDELEKMLKEYIGPRIDYVNREKIREMGVGLNNHKFNLNFLTILRELHEVRISGEVLDKSINKFYRFVNDLKSIRLSAFSSSMILPSLKPIVFEAKELSNEVKAKAIEALLESYSEFIIENILSRITEYKTIFDSRETFEDLDIEDRVRLKIFLKELRDIKASYTGIPSFIESQTFLNHLIDLFESVLYVDLEYVTELIPTLENAFFGHMMNHANALKIMREIEQHPKSIKKLINQINDPNNSMANALVILENIADQLKGFLYTVSASVELSLHWNIVEFEFVNRAMNDLITLLNTWDTSENHFTSETAVERRICKIIEITEYLMSDTFLSTFPPKYITSFHEDMNENKVFFKLILTAYRSIKFLIYGYNMTRQGESMLDLSERIESLIGGLKIEERIMMKPQFSTLAKILTEVSEYSNHIQYSISELELMENPIRNLVSNLLDSVITSIPH